MPAKLKIQKAFAKGRGVFSLRNIRKNQIIEICPVIAIPKRDRPHINSTILHQYYFVWGKGAAIALGLGSLYNHSNHPNAVYEKRPRHGVVVFRALRNILPGEEITVNYNGSPNRRSLLWFQNMEDRPRKKKSRRRTS